MSRSEYIYAGDELIETIVHDYGGIEGGCWEAVRRTRDKELKRTDFWASQDLSMSQSKKDYRQFLRDLPALYDSANEAYDAYDTYERGDDW